MPPISASRNAHPTIGMVGLGYVGLTTSACLASLGHRVIAMDIDRERVAALNAGKVPIHEPGLPELCVQGRERRLLAFTSSLEELCREADIIFLAVGTPPRPTGDVDLSQVDGAVEGIAQMAAEPKTLVMKSTVPVGTGGRLTRQVLASRGHHYVSNPEFLREGSAIGDFLYPSRVVVGGDDLEAVEAVVALYDKVEAPIIRTDLASAEMIKYASNAFLATKISFINEIANLCELTGSDVERVAEGMGLDPRIGPGFLKAGLGYGGSCFPKDTQALKELAGASGYHFHLLSAVIEVNRLQKARVISKLHKAVGNIEGKTIGVLGLAFKPGTDDIREACSLDIIRLLSNAGAKVKGYDPVAGERARQELPGVPIMDDPYELARGTDALILATEWPEFSELDFARIRDLMNSPVFIDGRNICDPERLLELGFIYDGVGRPSPVEMPEAPETATLSSA